MQNIKKNERAFWRHLKSFKKRKMRILSSFKVPKKVKGGRDPLGFFNIQSVAKYLKMKGETLIFFRKIVSNSQKRDEERFIVTKNCWKKWTLLLCNGFVFHVKVLFITVHNAQKVVHTG